MNPRTHAAAPLIRRVLDLDPNGGNLHVQLADGNLRSCFFRDGYQVHHPTLTSPEMEAAERACYDALLPLTAGERRRALALADRL